MKKFFLFILILNFVTLNCFSALRWKNDTRTMFQNNQLKIMEINQRTFGAKDLNGNGIIEPELGETSGNFVNAIDRLDELKSLGINAIHIMPITPVGKLKALGTAGSLYAISDFSSINPQLDVDNNGMDIFYEFENFVYECHLRNIRVIVDLPSCGAYDLYLKKPEIFYLNKNSEPVSPSDWFDVYLFKTLNDDGSLNMELYNLYREFMDILIRAKVDGIRADVATIKPYEFWKNLISYTRAYNTEFLFLAEASNSWTKPPCKECVFTSYKKLFNAGFDGYYGSYFDFKDWKNVSELEKQVKLDMQLNKKYKDKKSAITSFMTHDEQSPILIGGVNYATQIIWLNAVLPFNSYFVDGIQSGDSFIYPYANQKAEKTYTDNLYYYVHKGLMDIFNFSRRPGGNYKNLSKEIKYSNEFKSYANDVITKGSFDIIKTKNENIFAFIRKYKNKTIVVILNKDKTKKQSCMIKNNIFKNVDFSSIKAQSAITYKNNSIEVELEPSDIIVLYSDK